MPSLASQPSRRRRLLLAAAALVTGLLVFPGLGRHVFWEDEALTAFCARNFLQTGRITAWDGTNIAGYHGGLELDENLEVIFVPPQQYWLAAAGMSLFGDPVLGARFPFALLGIAGVLLVAWWSRRFFGETVPSPLPALLLALNVQFLLYVRSCRYYSPAVFWTLALLALWTPPPGGPSKPPPRAIHAVLRHLGAIIAVIGLFTTHTLQAAGALAVLPVFFLEPRFRNRSQLKLLGSIYAAGIAAGLWALSRGNSSEILLERRGTLSHWIVETLHLFWWHLRDMGLYEFFAWPVLLLLPLPWLVPGLADRKPVAKSAATLVAAILVYLAVTAVFTPQTTEHTTVADMRYVLPVLAVGTLVSAAGLSILWKKTRSMAIAVGMLLVFTNLLDLGATRKQNRHLGGRFLVRSSLYDHVHELLQPYDNTLDMLVKGLANLPANSSIYFQPETLCFTAMFHAPQHRYVGTLRPGKELDPALKEKLSPHVYVGAIPDFVLILSSLDQEPRRYRKEFRAGDYRYAAYILTHIFDDSRPDLLNHWFYLPPEPYRESGFKVYARTAPAAPGPK